MSKRGRKRRIDRSIPAHIEQAKVPKYCYWDSRKKHWYTKHPFTMNGGVRERIAGESALLSELHHLMEIRSGTELGSFNWLSSLYKESSKFKKLAPKTQKNYLSSEKIIKHHQTKRNSILLGQTAIRMWDDVLVQRLVDMVEESNGPTAANDCLKYIRIITKWGKSRGHCKIALGLDVDKAKERKRRRLPESTALNDLIQFAYERGSLKPKTKGSCAPYLWCALVIGYELRARAIETIKITDDDISETGIRNVRGKGSRTNITKWNQSLLDAKNYLVKRRQTIWANHRYPIPVRPSARFLFVTETGSPLAKSSLESSYKRFLELAIKENIISEEQKFGLHDLKRKGTTDTKGSRADKQEATGHKSESMMDVYDFSLPVVEPVCE